MSSSVNLTNFHKFVFIFHLLFNCLLSIITGLNCDYTKDFIICFVGLLCDCTEDDYGDTRAVTESHTNGGIVQKQNKTTGDILYYSKTRLCGHFLDIFCSLISTYIILILLL